MAEKKPSLAEMLAGEDDSDPKGESDMDDAAPTRGELSKHMHTAAEEMIDGVHGKDPAKVVAAMKTMHELSMAHAEAPEDEGDGEDEIDEGHGVDDEEEEEEAAGTDSP